MNKTRVLNLVKKDFEIISTNIFYMFITIYALAFFIPPTAMYGPIVINFLFIIMLFSGVGIKDEITLFLGLGVKRREYVLARYITLIILELLALPASFFSYTALTHKVSIIFTLLCILLGFLIIGISVPMYLKFNSTTANKILSPIIFALLPIAVALILVAYNSKSSFLFTTPLSTFVILCGLLSILILVLSIFISIRIYDKREFL